MVGAAVLLSASSTRRTRRRREKKSSYAPVDIKEDFASIMARMSAAKAGVMRRQMDLLAQRYDLANRAGRGREDVPRQGRAGRRARRGCRRA